MIDDAFTYGQGFAPWTDVIDEERPAVDDTHSCMGNPINRLLSSIGNYASVEGKQLIRGWGPYCSHGSLNHVQRCGKLTEV